MCPQHPCNSIFLSLSFKVHDELLWQSFSIIFELSNFTPKLSNLRVGLAHLGRQSRSVFFHALETGLFHNYIVQDAGWIVCIAFIFGHIVLLIQFHHELLLLQALGDPLLLLYFILLVLNNFLLEGNLLFEEVLLRPVNNLWEVVRVEACSNLFKSLPILSCLELWQIVCGIWIILFRHKAELWSHIRAERGQTLCLRHSSLDMKSLDVIIISYRWDRLCPLDNRERDALLRRRWWWIVGHFYHTCSRIGHVLSCAEPAFYLL